MEDFINRRFGHWVVKGTAPSLESPCGTKRRAFYCQCDCGNTKVVAKTQLTSGKSKSCGCKGSFLAPGQQFQEWTVLKKDEYTNEHGSQFYICKCSCGVERSVRMADLLNGSSKNCGHSRYILSKGAQAIKDYLTENNIAFYQEYVFSDLPNRRFDFAIYDTQESQKIIRLIEFDGQQHDLNSKSSWHTEELVQRDIEKNQYALTKGIPLVRIPYYKTTITEQDLFGEKYLIEE